MILDKDEREDKVKTIGEFWHHQDEVTRDFDFAIYNSKLWLFLKIILGISMLTLVYVLWAMHEIPWNIFGWSIGLFLIALVPLFVGLIIGFSFESLKNALYLVIVVILASVGLAFLIFVLPYQLHYAEYEKDFMLEVWYYFIMWILISISLVPAGAGLATATNVYE